MMQRKASSRSTGSFRETNRSSAEPLQRAAYGFLSHLSLAFASAVVCHCMLDGTSAPPSANARRWSITYPGQLPLDLPVDGQGFCRSNCRLASRLLFILPFEFRVHDAHRLLRERWLLLACPEFLVDEWWLPVAWCPFPAIDKGTVAKIIPRTKARWPELQ
jgi:hypothetical protein